MIIEVCTDGIESVVAAINAKASRIELCSALDLDGLTPSDGLIRRALQIFHGPVHVLIRPRAGKFVYTLEEIKVIVQDIERCKNLGVSGVVTGVLTPDDAIDEILVTSFIELAKPMEFTFHRAFDRVRNPYEALEKLIHCGCRRVLTSGLAPSAFEGKELIKQLVSQAGNRITILAGGGINSNNALQLAEYTGVEEIHLSAKTKVGSEDKPFEQYWQTNADELQNVIQLF